MSQHHKADWQLLFKRIFQNGYQQSILQVRSAHMLHDHRKSRSLASLASEPKLLISINIY